MCSYIRVTFVFCGLVAVAPILRSQQASSSTWKLKGAQLRLSPDTVLYEAKDSPPLTVVTKSITNVCYDTAIHARGPSAWEAAKSTAIGYPPPPGDPLTAIVSAPVFLAGIGGAAAVHATKSTQHFIILRWTPQPPEDASAGNSTSALTLEAEKGNFSALLNEFQRLTGKPWTDVSRRRDEVYARNSKQLKLAEKEKHAPYLAIKEKSRIGSSILDPYSYRAVLRAGPSGEGDLFLFAGAKKEMQLMAIVHVSVTDEKNGDSDALPIYESPAEPVHRVVAIRIPNETLTVTASQPYEYNPECPSLP